MQKRWKIGAFFFGPKCIAFFVSCTPKRDGITPIDRSTCDRRARSFLFSRKKSTIVLDLEKRPNVGTTNGTDEAMMVFLEESRMIFADMRLHATSTPTSTPTRYHHHQKYRAQNNNDCTATARFFLINLIINLIRYDLYLRVLQCYAAS